MISKAQGNGEDLVGYGFDSGIRLISIVVLALGLIALSGWFFNVPALFTLIPSSQPMAVR